ncbi:MAG TPA: hypothetical protein VNQ56_08575 [Pseudolabrys sp.]|nr:hypothetical protein [Pseudolabrys sp.]
MAPVYGVRDPYELLEINHAFVVMLPVRKDVDGDEMVMCRGAKMTMYTLLGGFAFGGMMLAHVAAVVVLHCERRNTAAKRPSPSGEGDRLLHRAVPLGS